MADTTIRSTRDMRGAAALRLLVAATLALLSLPLLSGSSSAAGLTNATPIVIPASGPPPGCPTPTDPPPNNSCPPTKATPYPSTITLTGVTGAITDVNVTLNALTYNSPADLDVMVEAPDGQKVMLMSDDCGVTNDQNPVAAINLTFDDSAAAPIPANTACASGTFKPSDDDSAGDAQFPFTAEDNFPAPAPAPPATTLPMSTLNASTPNGDWKLWVVDDYPGPENNATSPGQFAGGWSLDVTTTTSPTSPTSTTSTTLAGGTSTTSTTSTIVAPAAAPAAGAAGTTSTTSSSTAPILRLSSTSVPAGQRVTVAGDRFPANTALQLNFLSVPVSLGNVTTNATGSFQSVVTIPADATAGAHQINATNSGGTVLASVDLTVTRTGTTTTTSGRLARTGMDMRRATGVALLAMALGVLVLWSPTATRNRHHWKRRMSRRRLSGALTWR